MRNSLKALMCATALLGAMTINLSYAADFTADSFEELRVRDNQYVTYDNVTINSPSGSAKTDYLGILTVNNTLTNNNQVQNNGTIISNTIINNTGATIQGGSTATLTIENGGTNDGTIQQNIINFTAGDFANNNVITANTLNNGATISGSTGNITISSGGLNSGSITQNEINITGTTYTNNGLISASNFTNSAVLSGDGTLIASSGSNTGNITQDDVTINGDYTNSGTITASDSFTNTGVITGDNGSLNIQNGGTSSGNITQNNVSIAGSFTNTAVIDANTFTNSGSISGTGGSIITSNGTNSGSIIQNAIDVEAGGTFNNNGDGNIAASIDVGTLTNNGTFTNNTNSSVIADSIINNSSIVNNGSIGSDTDKGSIVNSGSIVNNNSIIASTITNNVDKSLTNNSTIKADTFNNSGTVSGENGNLTISTGGTNSGTITQNSVTVNGNYTNNDSITVTSFNNSATLGGSGNLTTSSGENTGNITQNNVTISGNYTNSGSLTSTGNFTNSGDITGTTGNIIVNNGSNSGSISQNSVTVNTNGTFANVSTGSIIANTVTNNGSFSNTGNIGSDTSKGSIVNNGSFTNSGTVMASEISNNQNKTFTNNNIVNAETVTNSGTITGTGDITIGGGTNSGTIEQDDVNIVGDFINNNVITSNTFTNNSALTGSGNLVITKGENTGTIEQNKITIQQDGTLTSSGSGSSITVNSVVNNGTIKLEGSEFNVSGGDIAGTVNAIGNNNSLNAGTGSVVGDLNIGDANNASSLNFEGGSIVGDAIVNISSNNSTLEISGGDATLNSNDNWSGALSLTGGNVTTDGITQNGAINATGGTLNIDNNSNITVGSNSTITQYVTTNIDSTSTLNINNGGNVTLNSGDSWDGTIVLGTQGATGDTSTLDVSGLATTGTLHGNSGILNVGSNNLDITTGSYIANAVAIETSGNINITGEGIVGIDDNDTLNSTSVITLKDQGTLNYGNTGNTQNPNFKIDAVSGNLNLLSGSKLTIDGSSSIADAVAIDIQQNSNLTLDAATLNLDNQDKWDGKIINENGIINANGLINDSETASLEQYDGVLNVYNDAKLTLGKNSIIEGGKINITKGTNGTEGSTFTLAKGTITGGNMTIDKDSAFIVKEGTFSLDKISGNGEIDQNGVMQAALVNTANGDRVQHTITELAINGQTNFNIDIHARGNHYTSNDTFLVENFTGNGVARVDNWSLNGDIFGWDAPIDRHINLDHIFVDKDGNPLQGNIEVTDKTQFTPIGWYQLNQKGSGADLHYTLDMVKFNPQVYRGQVATVAQWMNQLAIDDMLFTHSMVLPSFKDEDGGVAYSGIMANRYASTNPLFAPYQYSRKDGGLWYKMYGTFENLNMNLGGLGRVGNNAYGALIGADFGLKELKHGWKFMPTAYIGYNGAHQSYPGVGAFQNGGQAGFLGTWYKNNFIIGGLVYGGVYENSMDVAGHTDNAFNYFAGAATKLAYNLRLHKDWVLQPNLMAAYNFFGQQNWHSDYGQMGMMASMLNGVNLAPGVNLIWEKETFSIYGTLQYMYNLNGAVGGRAGNVGLPQVEMERGYIQYGIGFTKKIGDRFSGYLQAVLRNVGRTGVGFQMGFNILLGK